MLLELVGITEGHTGERCSSAGVVDYLLHNTTDVSMSLGVVEGSELGGRNSETVTGGEDATSTLSLVTNLER